jgi:hypothetical protein
MTDQIHISEGGKRILNTVKDELFPLTEKLKDLLIRAQRIRSTFFETNSRKLFELEAEHSQVSADFFVVATKLQTPDILFKGIKDDPQNIADYYQFQVAFQKNIDQGIGYMEIIDRTLDRKIQNIQNKITLAISIIAILVAILLR